jgi:hypothetical protein
VYNIDKIINTRSKISAIEKIDLLRDLEKALEAKLKSNAETRTGKVHSDVKVVESKEEIFIPNVSSNIDEDSKESIDVKTRLNQRIDSTAIFDATNQPPSDNPELPKAFNADQTMEDNEETKEATLPKAKSFCVSLGDVSTGKGRTNRGRQAKKPQKTNELIG